MPTSRQINQAIEILRRTDLPELTVMALDAWNAQRIMATVKHLDDHDEIVALFDGLDEETLRRAGVT